MVRIVRSQVLFSTGLSMSGLLVLNMAVALYEIHYIFFQVLFIFFAPNSFFSIFIYKSSVFLTFYTIFTGTKRSVFLIFHMSGVCTYLQVSDRH